MLLNVTDLPKVVKAHTFRVDADETIRGVDRKFVEFFWKDKSFFLLYCTVWRNKNHVRYGYVRKKGGRKKYKSIINIPSLINQELMYPEFYTPVGSDHRGDAAYVFAGFDPLDCADQAFLQYDHDRLMRIPVNGVCDEKLGKFKIVKPPRGLVV